MSSNALMRQASVSMTRMTGVKARENNMAAGAKAPGPDERPSQTALQLSVLGALRSSGDAPHELGAGGADQMSGRWRWRRF